MTTKITLRASFTILNKQMTQINKAERLAAVFGLFYKVTTNCNPKPYNKSLINLVCSVCTGKYCLRFLSHRPRSFVARSVRKTSGNTFPYRPPTRLISHYYPVHLIMTYLMTLNILNSGGRVGIRICVDCFLNLIVHIWVCKSRSICI